MTVASTTVVSPVTQGRKSKNTLRLDREHKRDIIQVPEVLNVQMNESEKKKKINSYCAGYIWTMKNIKISEKKIIYIHFLEGKLPLRIIHIKHRQPH